MPTNKAIPATGTPLETPLHWLADIRLVKPLMTALQVLEHPDLEGRLHRLRCACQENNLTEIAALAREVFTQIPVPSTLPRRSKYAPVEIPLTVSEMRVAFTLDSYCDGVIPKWRVQSDIVREGLGGAFAEMLATGKIIESICERSPGYTMANNPILARRLAAAQYPDSSEWLG